MIAETPKAPPAVESLEPLLVSKKVAAELVGLSARTWRRMETAGLVPAPIRCGGSLRWGVAELAAWVEAGCPSRDRWENEKARTLANGGKAGAGLGLRNSRHGSRTPRMAAARESG